MDANTLLRAKLDAQLDAFLISKQAQGLSPRTLTNYRAVLSRFVTWLTQHEVTALEVVTPDIVRSYFAELRTHGYSKHTVHDYCRPVKTWLKFAHTENVLPVDVMARVKMPAFDRRILPALTEDDISKLLTACENPRDVALLLLMLDTGCRASEVCALTVADVDTTTGAVQVRHGKGDKQRTVYLGAQARRTLARYLAGRETGPLFPSLRSGEHLTPNGLLQVLRYIGKHAGVHVSPHDFRRTFALTCLRNGMDIRRLAALMGHSDLTVIQRYLAVTEHDLAQAHREHGPVDSMLSRRGGR